MIGGLPTTLVELRSPQYVISHPPCPCAALVLFYLSVWPLLQQSGLAKKKKKKKKKMSSFENLENENGGRSLPSSVQKNSSQSQNPAQAVAAGIFQINTSVSAFRRLVDAVGTFKDTPDHRQKLHTVRQRIGQLVKDTSAKLKLLSESDRNSEVNPSKKIEDAKLARDFQATLQDYQKVQQLAAERESAHAPFSRKSSLPTSYASNELDADQESRPFIGEQMRLDVLMLGNEVAFNEAIIEERDQGMKDIQEEIGQTSEIFRDLAVLVHGQGVVIEDIGSNLESSSAVTAQAKTQLFKANKSVKSRSSSWCWWGLAILILVGVIVFIILINL